MAKDWTSIYVWGGGTTKPPRNFPTMSEAAKALNVSKKEVHACCEANRKSDGITYETVKGYVCQYEHEK